METINTDYFDDLMQNRTLLIWAVACRRQLDRWLPHVVESVKAETPTDTWAVDIDHHFLLVACAQLLKAIELFDADIEVPAPNELREARDALEHWENNMPIFNRTPRTEMPTYPRPKAYAERNPGSSPFFALKYQLSISTKSETVSETCWITKNVTTEDVHVWLDAVERFVLARDPGMARFLGERRLDDVASLRTTRSPQ